jgi:histidinol-phosphate/aromatic aminotransferase/cobyric acid decarboxylase-like protein/GNAT superfamily N-acetyltransferase
MKNIADETGWFTLRLATETDREEIYRLRHEVYARELGQHQVQPGGVLRDSLDEFNIYLVAEKRGEILGFISITPPGHGHYSLDKYVSRSDFAALFQERPFELRLLTVRKPQRGRALASLLSYAAFRWVEQHGGTRIIGMGRREIFDYYRRLGMEGLDRQIRSGAASFELMTGEIERLRGVAADHAEVLNRFERAIDWRLDFPFQEPAKCFHGGASFEAIGDEFDHLERRQEVISADVLDAWFPPSPKVIESLQDNLEWLVQSSPPADCAGMARAIARARGVAADNILPAGGSSDLIFLAMRDWLTSDSRVLLLDPTYGEYPHVLEQIVRCRLDRFALAREDGYQVNLNRLQKRLVERNFDLVILVNPNSPTGQLVPRAELERVLERAPARTRIWVDETYIDYAGPGESLERFAAGSDNVVVCKSMSKVYALSGARAAYLCAHAGIIEQLRAVTPPWAVSLPAQVAAVKALEDTAYYSQCWTQTRDLREALGRDLAKFRGWEIIPGRANFLLCHLPVDGPDAEEVIRRCKLQGLYLRDAGAMGTAVGQHALRIAVKDEKTNHRLIEILRSVLAGNRKTN